MNLLRCTQVNFVIDFEMLILIKYFLDVQLASVCVDLFSAGTDAMSSLMTFSFMMLCIHPEIQDKLFSEIEKVVGTERIPSYADRQE